MRNDLLARNRDRQEQLHVEEPECFTPIVALQVPEFFWIACSNIRVPTNVVADLDPGEVFVHRNVANTVHSSDLILPSALEFVVEVLNAREIIVCSRYVCGGARSATEDLHQGLADQWLEPIWQLARVYAVDLGREPNIESRHHRLVELHVVKGVRRVCETPILQRAWSGGAKVPAHGVVHGLKGGRLRDLECSIGPGRFRTAHFGQEAAQ